jgi:hypothetical protein
MEEELLVLADLLEESGRGREAWAARVMSEQPPLTRGQVQDVERWAQESMEGIANGEPPGEFPPRIINALLIELTPTGLMPDGDEVPWPLIPDYWEVSVSYEHPDYWQGAGLDGASDMGVGSSYDLEDAVREAMDDLHSGHDWGDDLDKQVMLFVQEHWDPVALLGGWLGGEEGEEGEDWEGGPMWIVVIRVW